MTKYIVEAQIEIELEGEEEFDEAFALADVILQRAWDTDQGRHHVHKWHFSILEDAVRVVEEPDQVGELAANVTDV
jgi:hypothetical protein